MGLVAPRHVGSSRTRDRTRVPCIGRRILNHCATREVPRVGIFILLMDVSQVPGTMSDHFRCSTDICTVVVGTVAQSRAPGRQGWSSKGLGEGAAAGPLDLWSEGMDSVPCLPEGAPAPFYPACPPPWNNTPMPALHTHVGAHLHLWPRLPPPSPGARTTDVVAVVSWPQRCRLESGRHVLCGCSSRWGWGTDSPANRHAQRPLLPPPLLIYTCTRICTQADGQPRGPSKLAALRPQAWELCTHL